MSSSLSILSFIDDEFGVENEVLCVVLCFISLSLFVSIVNWGATSTGMKLAPFIFEMHYVVTGSIQPYFTSFS